MPRGNPDKLIPNSARTPQELKKMTSNGGKKSGETRRKQKTLRDTFKTVLADKFDANLATSDLAKAIADKHKGIDNYAAIAYAATYQVVNGNMAGLAVIRDTIGEKPVDKAEVANKVDISPRLEKLIANVSKRLGDNGRAD